MRRFRRYLLPVFAVLFLGAGAVAIHYPPFPAGNTVDEYFGTPVDDPYRQLEKSADPAVIAWGAAETKLATDYLRAQPSFPIYAKRVDQLERGDAATYDLQLAGGRFFYQAYAPGEEQTRLVVRDRIDGPERVLFDPRNAVRNGVEPSISEYAPSPDGSKVILATAYGGDEKITLYVLDVQTGTSSDAIPRVGGGSVSFAWDADSRGFIHTVWPNGLTGPSASTGMLIAHHTLGARPSSDTYLFGKSLSTKAEYALQTSRDGNAIAIFETDGDGVHGSIYARWGRAPFVRVATPSAGIGASDSGFPGAFVGDSLYVVSHRRSAFGEVLAIGPGGSIESARVVVPASDVAIQSILPAAGGFLTSDLDGGDARARLFSATGKLRAQLPIPPVSSVEFAAEPTGGQIMFDYESYATPLTRMSYDVASNTATRSALIAQTSIGDPSNFVVEREMVPSRDGKVRIPLEIVRAKSTALDGTAPTILNAYGAYGITNPPTYRPAYQAWLERGGIYARAMVRGGGEYGDAWHTAAYRATKTLSSDDLASCADWLAAHGYASSSHLGINGASAGGFLMGLALTRDPQRYRAVVADVGIYDVLRFELTPNGAYNTPEFGTVRDPVQFAWMIKQSPYHNVVPGRPYPAVLMRTGANDPRVDPYNSRKMIARLQADSSSGYPVLLLQRSDGGHGLSDSLDQATEEIVTMFTFLDGQLR